MGGFAGDIKTAAGHSGSAAVPAPLNPLQRPAPPTDMIEVCPPPLFRKFPRSNNEIPSGSASVPAPFNPLQRPAPPTDIIEVCPPPLRRKFPPLNCTIDADGTIWL